MRAFISFFFPSLFHAEKKAGLMADVAAFARRSGSGDGGDHRQSGGLFLPPPVRAGGAGEGHHQEHGAGRGRLQRAPAVLL